MSAGPMDALLRETPLRGGGFRTLGWTMAAALAFAADANAARHTAQLRLAHQGVAIDGVRPIEFAVFGAAAGGTPISVWTADPVSFEDGLATLSFSIDPILPENQATWVEVRIQDPASSAMVALSPRIALTAVPVAVVAQRPVAGSVGVTAVDPDQVQRRSARVCQEPTPRMSTVDRTGEASSCVGDRGIEGINAGLGISIVNGTLLGLNLGQVQRRESLQCDPGASIRAIPVVGLAICVPDADQLGGLTRVSTTCVFPGTQGVQTGCAATPRCPAEAPVAVGGTQFSSCPAVTVNASVPVNDSLGQGWASWMLKKPEAECAASVTVTAEVICVVGP